MLFWFLIFLIARQSGLTQGHPDLLARVPTEASCDCTVNSCRTLFDIVWGCLATIFACTWVALHQNVPDLELGWFSLLLRKLKMMLVTIIAPEVVVAFAGRQLVSALYISKVIAEFNVSKRHGFFCTMGGFISEECHPIANIKQLPVYMPAIQAIHEEDIKDRSKGDTLSKGVALAQGLWFVTQCAARVSQHLPVTELEVATLAFAVISTFIRVLWWSKPLDVQRPIVVVRSEVDPLQDVTPTNYRPYLFDWLNNVLFGQYDEYSPLSSTSVPSFYSIPTAHGIMNFAGVYGVATIFGGIHCAAWNALFPSTVEMWMWRMGSVFIAAFPVLAIFLRIGVSVDNLNIISYGFIYIGLVVYILCRLILIALSFTTLRALPPSAFVDVNWSKYFPHL
ncbi:hypothetical protein C8F04DRAFT_959856 [Mycena alexandri]|uniref:Integral membrane protein n=1 Tax=Mycena alexandri TaxID=1745969 RepID=A0AAD6SU60_9AGAR|nr:hypothetical protein C8F04DRAFT_959856 [Mycena alexandri]